MAYIYESTKPITGLAVACFVSTCAAVVLGLLQYRQAVQIQARLEEVQRDAKAQQAALTGCYAKTPRKYRTPPGK